jgi:hypothetical protein
LAALNLITSPARWRSRAGWRLELLLAAPIVAFVLYLFYVWFAIRDRYQIFLYFHNMGPGFDTTPFGRITASRYWMAGLVASGAVMVLYLAAAFVAGRVSKGFRAPAWWRLWLLCTLPLAIGIPAIVMTANDPVLPLAHAARVTCAALIGLALAVSLGSVAAGRPLTFLVLLVDGFALACLLIGLIQIENYSRWLARGGAGYIYLHLALLAAGIVLLLGMTAVYALWRRPAVPAVRTVTIAGFAVTYLLLPLYHHLFWSTDEGSWCDPGYFTYISDADKYFARSLVLQLAVWVATVLIALAITRLRVRWRARRFSC